MSDTPPDTDELDPDAQAGIDSELTDASDGADAPPGEVAEDVESAPSDADSDADAAPGADGPEGPSRLALALARMHALVPARVLWPSVAAMVVSIVAGAYVLHDDTPVAAPEAEENPEVAATPEPPVAIQPRLDVRPADALAEADRLIAASEVVAAYGVVSSALNRVPEQDAALRGALRSRLQDLSLDAADHLADSGSEKEALALLEAELLRIPAEDHQTRSRYFNRIAGLARALGAPESARIFHDNAIRLAKKARSPRPLFEAGARALAEGDEVGGRRLLRRFLLRAAALEEGDGALVTQARSFIAASLAREWIGARGGEPTLPVEPAFRFRRKS